MAVYLATTLRADPEGFVQGTQNDQRGMWTARLGSPVALMVLGHWCPHRRPTVGGGRCNCHRGRYAIITIFFVKGAEKIAAAAEQLDGVVVLKTGKTWAVWLEWRALWRFPEVSVERGL